MSSGKNCVGFQVSGIQYGTLIIEVYSDASTVTRCNYTVKDGGSSFSTSDAGSGTSSTAGEPIIVTGLTKTSAYVYVGRQGSSYTKFSKIIVKTPNPTGKTYAESTFYTTYASSSKTNAQLISSASFPENFLPIFAGASALDDKPASTPTVTTPYDFSCVSTSSNSYILQTANNNVLLLNNVANVKSVRFYGDGNGSSGNISVNVTKQSGSGSTFSVSNISFTSTKTILEHSTGDLTGKSGYDANTFYNYKFTFSKKFHIWGVYVEAIVAEKDYTVTAVSSNDTYGTVSAEASSLDEGETTTITATPATGYQVTNWAVSGTGANISPSGASNSNTTTLTMGTANATVTATFGPKSYTVTLNNQSATTPGTENVTTTYNSNTNLTSAITKPTKDGKVFAGYFTAANGGGVQLIDPAGNWIASAGGNSTYMDGSKNWKNDGNLTLYACWMEYCPGMDMAAEAIRLGSGEHKTWDNLTTNKILYSLSGNTAFDDSSDASNAYDGLKFKNNGDYILFLVQANSSLKLYFGYTDTKPKISINGGSESDVNVTSTKSKTPNQEVDFGTQTYDRLIKLRTVTSNTVVLQKIEITAASGCSAYEFHYGTNGQDNWETECFEQVGETNEWKIEDFTIPSTTHFYVGYHGDGTNGWNSTWSSERAWTDWPTKSDNKWQGQIFLAPNDGALGSFAVGQATGAVGTLTIHSDYNDLNKYLSFTPNGYGITYGGTGHAFVETATSNMYETDVVTLPDVSTTYNIGLATATEGTYVKSIHSKATDEAISAMGVTEIDGGKKKIYLNAGVWKADASGEKMAIWDATDGHGYWGANDNSFMTYNSTSGLFEGYVNSDATKIVLVRLGEGSGTPNWENKWNQTPDITLSTLNNKFSITAWKVNDDNDENKKSPYSVTTMHPTTGQKGKFRMWANSADQNWYVHFIPYYVLSYDANGGSGTTAATERNSEDATLTVSVASNGFTAPTGKHFVNWGTTTSGGTTYTAGASYSLTADATLYAQWAWNTYDVSTTLAQVNVKSGTTGTGAATYGSDYTVTLQGATGYNLPASVTVMRGSTNITANCTWTQGTGVLIIPAAQVTGNISISATGIAKTTAITLEAGEGGTDGSATATYGTSTITDYVPATRTGYTLGNYYIDDGDHNILTKEGTLNTGNKGLLIVDSKWASEDAEVTLYAQWTAIDYSLSYTLNGGSVASPNPTSYTIESSAITLNNPTKTGYTFAGWTGTDLVSATTTVTIAAGSTGNRSYTATWTPIVPSSVSLKASTTITVGGTETLTATISPAEVADNTITWTSSDETVATVTSAGVVTGVKAGTATITATTVNDKTATCEVTVAPAVTYTVTYVYNGATSGDETESATGASVTLPNPSKTGYTLQGWYTSSGSLAGAATATYNPTSNITLYALWREDACAGGGGGSTTIFSISDMSWSPYSAANTTITIYPTGTPDKTYTATLVGASTVSVVNTNGSEKSMLGTNTIKIGGNDVSMRFTLTSGTLQNGDVISFTNSGTNQLSFTTTATRNTTPATTSNTYTITKDDGLAGSSSLYVWRPGSTPEFTAFTITRAGGSGTCYYVTYNGNGADGGFTKDEASHASGSNVTVKTNSFTKTGYTFTGWNTVDNGSGTPYTASGTISGISGNMILYAQWIESGSTYDITYHCNDATSGCPDNATGQVALPDPLATPTKTNYSFGGWYTNVALSSEAVAGATLDGDADLYAKWTQTITLKTGTQGSGADKTPTVVWQGTALNGFSAHAADGYTLQGYYTAGSGGVKVLNADGTFAAANVTDYITSSKWSRTGAAPTLFAQWVATEDCRTLKYAWKATGKFCDDESTSVTSSDTVRFPANASNLYFTESGTGNTVSAGSSYNIGKTKDNYFLLTAKSGYQIKSICFYGKVQDSSVDYTTDNSTWTELESTKTDGDDYYSFNGINASHFGIKLTATSPKGIWIRNMVIEVCAAGGTTYNVTYDGNDKTGGTAPTDASSPYAYGATVTVLGNTGSLEKTNYTFAGWTTNDDGTGSSYEAGSTFSITDNTTLYAKWTQSVTLNKNGGSTDGSATAVWNATGLTGITHAKPAAGYKLLGYYSASSDGTKVLNSDGSFAATNVTGYITSGKWSRTSATTLYAEYESAGALTWNLIVDSDTANLSTSTKTSAFTEISTTNMTNAALVGGLTYDKSKKKSSLTGKISTPASYDADKYVYVTFQVASGYKFTPSSIKVIAQPVTTGKDVKLSLTDGAYHSLVSSSATSISGGSTQTVTLAGDGTYFTGTVTLKIYCYGATDAYRLGTPITIEGEIEEACATMPSYTSMSYTTTTFAPNADASGSPITIVGGDNINTYQWKYNTVNDRTSGNNCGTNNASLTPLTDAGAAIDGTRYYWCEMTNGACGITIKSPAVAITVAAAKSDATVAWTDPASTPNYGGGGYTIKATVNETEWNGNAADLVITAPAGINIYNVTSGTASSQKWVQADFDVQTSFDRTTYASNIPFTVSAAATASYNAISNDHNTAYSACTGAGEGSSYKIRMRKTITKDGNYYHCANTDGWISPNINSSYSTGKAGTKMETDFDTVASSNTQYVWVRTYHANVNKVRIYADFRADNMTVSKVYKHTAYFSADSKYEVDYTAVYNDDEENENTGTAAQGYVDITLDEVMAANDILLVKFNDSKVRPLGAVITEGSAGSLNTHLQWSGDLENNAEVGKYTTDAYFTYSASKITENTNTLGTITYSSSNTSVATVDATGKVALIAAGSTTIKATLAASGCYKKAEISYTLNVTEVPCTITAGTLTLTSGTESKCSSANVTLTLTGFESGASIQWKDGDANIINGGNYTIATDGTTSTLTTNQEGTYSVMVTKDCSVRSNRITISNKSTEVGAKRIVKNWYIKNGRPTPDIELWTLQNGAHLSSVAWDPTTNTTGLTASDFYESDGKVYLKGKEPSSNTSGKDIDYTLTLTVADDCGSTTAMSASGQLIYLHHQQNTDKHVLAFVVNGTDKGGFTEGITAAQTTSVPLYNEIAANFDVLATNIYSTDDEQALKEYYSQFDILCVTDYPNTGTKGVNKKSYVDALGALVDIRPILTMEAFVAKLANWKAKGISGTPQSPTTRQYTMLLQCKDHEIFSGTKLTKVGEGDETMYRVSMVCDTLEDYKTLDATYGSGTHAEKDGYNYGGKPALQGFTFTKEMLDNDLLPLGLINDGSGNDLQVGIERQRNMEARLMVLGINSYAMERLTDDGQTVVVNALKYLMKKNSEDIADCSNMFVGGDDEEDESTRYDWNVASHWSGNAVPDRTQKVRIVAPCVIKADDKVHVTGVVIAPSGKYNHGANTANGSLTIAAGGALIVDGKVEAATAPLYTETRPTSPSDLTIQTSSTAQGALIFDNDKGETQATVEMYSPSYWEVMEGTNKKKSYWSYVGVPIQDVPVGEYFYGAVTYLYDETSGWIRKRIGSEFHAFEGIGLSLPEGHTETFYGTLASTETKEITLTKTTDVGEGDNLIGNSWTAPIQIGNFDSDDFGSATAVVSMYKTGRDDKEGNPTVVTATAENDGAVEAGQWISIPIGLPGTDGYDGPTVIPSMQAFQVTTSSETTLTLDYDKLVRDVTIATDNLTQPMSAPKRKMKRAAKKSLDAMMRVRMSGFKTRADLWIMEDGRFSDEYDNGWEANYIECDNRSPQLYANSEIGKMAFLAKPDIEGTILGIAPSLDGNEYLFTFHYVGDEEFYLNDLKLKQSVLISEEESYSFMYEDGDTNRFYISRTRIDAPQMPTGVENTHGDAVKARKFIYNDKLYIMLNGRVYSAEGQIVK